MTYEDSLKKARLQYDAAHHLLHVTYPLVKDPKLLMGIVNNIFFSMEAGMDAILKYGRELRLVPKTADNFTSKFNIFRHKSVRLHKIPASQVQTISIAKNMIEAHKRSPVEFQRGDRFVICNESYNMQTVSAKDLRGFLDETKAFLELIEGVIYRNK